MHPGRFQVVIGLFLLQIPFDVVASYFKYSLDQVVQKMSERERERGWTLPCKTYNNINNNDYEIILRESSIVLLCVSYFPAHDGITSIFMRDDLLFLCFCLV